MKLSFLECYQILEISNDCDWLTLRKKYKTLIQKCHPDRFTEHSAEHKNAEELIRSYNAAYKLIADFYAIHKALPPRTPNQSANTNKKRTPRNRPSVTPHVVNNKNKETIKKPVNRFSIRKAAITLFLAGGLYLTILYLYIPLSPDSQDNALVKKTPFSHYSAPNNGESNKEFKADPISNSQFFTTGSSLGEVILIQGQPTRTEGDTWYYGKSSVTFTKGVVLHWFRHPQFPLHVRRNEAPSFQYKLQNATEKDPDNRNQPYWQR